MSSFFKNFSAFRSICTVLLILQSVPFISAKWTAEFLPNNKTIDMYDSASINLTITGLEKNNLKNASIYLKSDTDIIHVNKTIDLSEVENGTWIGQFVINAIFLGGGNIFVIIDQNGLTNRSAEHFPVVIIRKVRFIDKLFTFSVAALVSVLYINFGAALDLSKVKGIMLKPVGITIALVCEFLFMPLVSDFYSDCTEKLWINNENSFGCFQASYFLGLYLFPNSVEMQLGLFFTGISPAGGASDVWTVVLGGNLDLSIAMTTISTFAAFGKSNLTSLLGISTNKPNILKKFICSNDTVMDIHIGTIDF